MTVREVVKWVHLGMGRLFDEYFWGFIICGGFWIIGVIS
jgi:hypothetical protein